MTVETKLHTHADGSFAFERVQDVEPILEFNKALRDQPQINTDGLKHIASIPNVVVEQWLNEHFERTGEILSPWGEEFGSIVRKKLADHDYMFLRTDR